MTILRQYQDKLEAVAHALLEQETLSAKEFNDIFPSPVEKRTGTPLLTTAA